jgi:hypothetical protein
MHGGEIALRFELIGAAGRHGGKVRERFLTEEAFLTMGHGCKLGRA